jgi:hypothetical protein
MPAGACSSLDPSLGLPEVFAERGQRLFVSFAAKHGGRGAFMVSKRSMGIKNSKVQEQPRCCGLMVDPGWCSGTYSHPGAAAATTARDG